MLDRILSKALEGITVIEDDTDSVGRTLAGQLGNYAETSGRSVGRISLDEMDSASTGEAPSRGRKNGEGVKSGSPHIFGYGQAYVTIETMDYDLLVVDGLSAFLYDKTTREVVDLVRRIVLLSKRGRSFIITIERSLLGEKTTSYLKSQADSVVVVRTEISADRVIRSLFVQKLRGAVPEDRLIKFTLDERGLQVDTREFLG